MWRTRGRRWGSTEKCECGAPLSSRPSAQCTRNVTRHNNHNRLLGVREAIHPRAVKFNVMAVSKRVEVRPGYAPFPPRHPGWSERTNETIVIYLARPSRRGCPRICRNPGPLGMFRRISSVSPA